MTMSANDLWRNIIRQLLTFGDEISPRGIATKEFMFLSDEFDMNSPICYHQNRRLNYSFSAAEAYFIAHGDNRVENLAQYNKNIAQFSDDGMIFNGSYGPPFNSQLMYVVNTLANDLYSRQAVLTIWKENPVVSADIRCTIALQFLVRNGRIHTKVTMRSSDVWLGIPYDLFNFTIMTLRVLTLLNAKLSDKISEPIKLGTMHWSAGSSHIYVHDIEKAKLVLETGPDKEIKPVPEKCFTNWPYVVSSLIACRDKNLQDIKDNQLWEIRP